MNSKKIILTIGLILLVFVILKGIASQLCEPKKGNAVVALASDVLSNQSPTTSYSQVTSPPDPLSWTPFFQRLTAFFLKACSR